MAPNLTLSISMAYYYGAQLALRVTMVYYYGPQLKYPKVSMIHYYGAQFNPKYHHGLLL